MLGIYDYTVLLTYLSLVSAGTGIVISLSGNGHPYIGVFLLLFCGLCDAFDGKVARTKKDRTEAERNYGIQIDSLSDLVAFGVLPACIGVAMLCSSPIMRMLRYRCSERLAVFLTGVLGAVLVLYILAAMIRLAYFNVTEEERQRTEDGVRRYYTGLPVTAAALIFPPILLLQRLLPLDVTPVYFITAVLTGFAFLSRIQIRKPSLKGVLLLIGIGAVEFAAVFFGELYLR